MLVMVIWTKRIFESIFVSIIVALLFSHGTGFVGAFIDHLYGMLAHETYSWVLLMLLFFGGLIKLLEQSGGTLGFGIMAERYIKSGKGSLFVTYILGLLIFIDDYLNNLSIGAAMRGITDKYKVPREMTAFTINSTGAPMCVLVPFSTWAVFVFGLMQESGVGVGESILVGYGKVIPFVFYALVCIVMVPLLIYGILPKFGPMKAAYERAGNGGGVFPPNARISSEEVDEDRQKILDRVNPRLRDFLVPMVVVIALTIYTDDLIYGVLAGILSCFVLYIPNKNMKVSEFFDNLFEGMKEMLFIGAFIMMAFIFVDSVNSMGFSDYIIGLVKPYMVGGLIPLITFLVIGAMAFAGIDFWGVMILAFPIVIPLSQHFDVNVYLSIGAIVSGGVVGGHACFFSEPMIMSSTSCQIGPVDEAVTLFPYAILAAAVSAVLFLAFGFML